MGGFMAKLKTRDKKVAVQKALLRLEQQRNELIAYQQQIEPALEEDGQRAKQLVQKGNREEAMTALRRRRNRQRQLASSNAQLDKLDQIISDLELVNEVSHKPKRGKWRSIIKRKFKKNRRSSETRKKVGEAVDEDIEIQVLEGLSKKERRKTNKVYTKARQGIQKQKQIDKAMTRSLKLESGDDEAVEEELEEILNGSYQLP